MHADLPTYMHARTTRAHGQAQTDIHACICIHAIYGAWAAQLHHRSLNFSRIPSRSAASSSSFAFGLCIHLARPLF